METFMTNKIDKQTAAEMLQTLLEDARNYSFNGPLHNIFNNLEHLIHEYDFGRGVSFKVVFDKNEAFCYPTQGTLTVNGETLELTPEQGCELFLSLPG